MNRRMLMLCTAAALLASCASPRLYYWGSNPGKNGTTLYEQLAYKQYDQQTPESLCDMIALYENMVTHPGGQRGTIPPGICAEYGYLLLQDGAAETFEAHAKRRQKSLFATSDYAALFAERGLAMLKKEMELYPESKQFIGPILKRFSEKADAKQALKNTQPNQEQ